MTAPDAIIGAQRYLVLCDETTWGTVPGSPTWVNVPVTSYGVLFQQQNRQADTFVGVFPKLHSSNYRGMPQGTLAAPLFGWHGEGSVSLAQLLVDWAFGDPGTQDLRSKAAQWAGPNVDNKQHSGLRVNQGTISGSEDNGGISISLELQGKAEVGQSTVSTSQALPTSRHRNTEFEFVDAGFEIDDGAGGSLAALNIKNFNLQIQNGLKVEYLNSSVPSLLVRTTEAITFSCEIIKTSDTYDTFRRMVGGTNSETDFVGQLTLKGLHNGTGAADTNWNQVVIALNRMALVNPTENQGLRDVNSQVLNFTCLKPDTASNPLTFTWSDVA
jgi:hypothetical protein